MNIFSEIYGAYFRAAARLLSSETTDEKSVNEVIKRECFRDSILFLPQKLIPGSSDWGLFRRRADGTLERITKNPPVNILTGLQKKWLRAKLSDPRIRLFMDEETISRLEERLKDVPPLYRQEHFRIIDRFSDCDEFCDEGYISVFRTALDAVKRRRIVYIEFLSGKGKRMSGKFVLLKMEYSPKNGFTAIC